MKQLWQAADDGMGEFNYHLNDTTADRGDEEVVVADEGFVVVTADSDLLRWDNNTNWGVTVRITVLLRWIKMIEHGVGCSEGSSNVVII